MKKYIIPIVLCCLCACTTELPDTGADIDTAGHTLFSVDIENLSLGGSSIPGSWNAGDRRGVFGSESGQNVPYYLKRQQDGLQAASFYGGLVKGKVLAYAPFDETVSAESVPCQLEHVQQFQAKANKAEWFLRYNPRTFAALGEDGVLHFGYPMGLLSIRFEFVEPLSVQAISLKGKNGISGWMEVDWNAAVRPTAISHKEITLDLGGETVPTRSGSAVTEFLFALPPAVYAAGDLSISVSALEEELSLDLRELEVKRVEGTDFPVTNVTVKSSDLPGYDKEEGYLE